jgi:hypothetical protein
LVSGDLPQWKIHRRIGGRFTADAVNRAIRALEHAGIIYAGGRTTRGETIYTRRPNPRGQV